MERLKKKEEKQIKDAAKSITTMFKMPGHDNTANKAGGQISFRQPTITQSIANEVTDGDFNHGLFL